MAIKNKYRNSITIFDIDDTIVVTKSKIKVSNPKTGFFTELTPQEFNTFEGRDSDKMDFSDFRNAEILKGGKIIEWVFKILKRTLQKGKPVGIITARDNSKLIREFLLYHNIRISPDFIFAVNDPNLGFSGTVAEKKNQAFERFIDMGFTDFKFFDDDTKNIKIAKSIPSKYPKVKMKPVLIKQKWIPTLEKHDVK